MTLDRVQGIVLRLANVVPTRYWVHVNYPEQEPWLMGVKPYYPKLTGRNFDRMNQITRGMHGLGGKWDDDREMFIFERTNEDGTPFRSNL